MTDPIASRAPSRQCECAAKGAQMIAATPTGAACRVDRARPAAWVAGHPTDTNELLVGALHALGLGAELVHPPAVVRLACRGEHVHGRLDVRRTLDGVEDGIWEYGRVEHRDTRALNPAPSLLACHDNLHGAPLRRGARTWRWVERVRTLTCAGGQRIGEERLPRSAAT
jgi:hypothetical protein